MWLLAECVTVLRTPLMYGDRFYAFLCSVCNGGEEFLLRMHMRWVDFVHLSTFHLSMLLGKRDVDIDADIVPFMDENSQLLQLPKEVSEAESARGGVRHRSLTSPPGQAAWANLAS